LQHTASEDRAAVEVADGSTNAIATRRGSLIALKQTVGEGRAAVVVVHAPTRITVIYAKSPSAGIAAGNDKSIQHGTGCQAQAGRVIQHVEAVVGGAGRVTDFATERRTGRLIRYRIDSRSVAQVLLSTHKAPINGYPVLHGKADGATVGPRSSGRFINPSRYPDGIARLAGVNHSLQVGTGVGPGGAVACAGSGGFNVMGTLGLGGGEPQHRHTNQQKNVKSNFHRNFWLRRGKTEDAFSRHIPGQSGCVQWYKSVIWDKLSQNSSSGTPPRDRLPPNTAAAG